jgi:hypothetical protein
MYSGFFPDEGSDAMKPSQKFDTPLGVWLPLNDLYPPPPSSWVQRLCIVVHETQLNAGSHFIVLEIGSTFVGDV